MEIETTETGEYREKGQLGLVLGDDLQRFTVVDESTEELDVDARDAKHAKAIAKAAWALDYEGPFKPVEVIGPRIGLYM